MRLRHIKKNVAEQNWLAVFLDFLIVVLGVFVGIQLGNWNEDRQVRAALEDAKQRFVAENQANIDATDKFLDGIDRNLGFVGSSLDVLRRCETGLDAQNTVNTGLNVIRGTAFLNIRRNALTGLTANDDFLSLLDETDREALKEFERGLVQTQKTLDWLEQQPFKNHIEDLPGIGFGELVDLSTMDGAKIRLLSLEQPLEEACQDQQLLRAFYLWERTSTFQMLRARQLKETFVENLERY